MRTLTSMAVTALLLATGCMATDSEQASTDTTAAATTVSGLSDTFNKLPTGWHTLKPGGATSCADGSDYKFHVRAGDPNKLLVYLQGGGACWSLETCDPLFEPTYSIQAGDAVPERYDGIFNYQRTDNPFKDHTVVFAPYCSADVHIGHAEHTYTRSEAHKAKIRAKGEVTGAIADEFNIVHRGFANMAAVLDWTRTNVNAPEQIFVTGSSAGSIPSPYYAMHLAQLYPNAQVTQLGDGAGGYRRVNQVSTPNAVWNTVTELRKEAPFADLSDDTFNYEQLYIRAASAAPDVEFNAYDAAEDEVQKRFLELGGVEMPSLLEAISANQQDIRARVRDFRSYIAGGDSHTILARPEFYTFTVGSQSIRDWVADLASGEPVDNIVCGKCGQEETLSAR